MRKIEKQMIEAIRSGDNWKSANTEVRFWERANGIASVYLHGHHIATVIRRSNENLYPCKAYPIEDTFRDWPTATTRSRLRALGVDASIKNFQACIDGRAL